MPKVVEGLTTTTSEMVMVKAENGGRLYTRNIFYQSKRNFVLIRQGRLSDPAARPVEFHFEGHEQAHAMSERFIGPSDP